MHSDLEESSGASAWLPEEQFTATADGRFVRRIAIGEWTGPAIAIDARWRDSSTDGLRAAWDQAWLRSTTEVSSPRPAKMARCLRVVDLFAGCGAMSLGLKMAAEAIGYRFVPRIAADFDAAALSVYDRNLSPELALGEDLSAAVRFEIDPTRKAFIRPPRFMDDRFEKIVDEVDVLLGGPPCQGHSDLNNHSRRADPKNSLYLLLPAFAYLLRPRIVIIENVPAVVHDRANVVATTIALLRKAGYHVTTSIAPMSELGVAQRRRRHVLVATRTASVDLDAIWKRFATRPRSVRWAVADLSRRKRGGVLDTPSVQSTENQARLRWLLDNDEYDLPNSLRPRCHLSDHSYKSMYGRIRWDEPAQTITSGFGSPGQGRYGHPTHARTITPHEAARLQYFPDFFHFEGTTLTPKRTQIALMIGNAVPPKLTYVVGLAALAAIYRPVSGT